MAGQAGIHNDYNPDKQLRSDFPDLWNTETADQGGHKGSGYFWMQSGQNGGPDNSSRPLAVWETDLLLQDLLDWSLVDL